MRPQKENSMLVKMEVPFEFSEKHRVSNDMAFDRFLPRLEDSIQIEENDLSIKMGFDNTCLSILGPKESVDVSKFHHVPVEKVLVEVTVNNVSQPLLNHIMSGSPSEGVDKAILDDYDTLGVRIYEFTIKYVNRLIQFARAKKGQYWLEEFVMDSANIMRAFGEFSARAYIDGKQYKWRPRLLISSSSIVPSGDVLINQDDWRTLPAFLERGKSPLVGQLLAGAWFLNMKGHRRAALTEAVIALDVAVADFSRNPRAERIYANVAAKRMNIDTLSSQVDRLGLSCTLNYLLPLILPEDTLSTEVINGCQAAILMRQNVVHCRQRIVDKEKLLPVLRSITSMCRTLNRLTAESADEIETNEDTND